MVKKIIWSQKAFENRKEIFEYWLFRNKSDSYSKRLDILFNKALKLISIYPELGRQTNIHRIRVKIVKDYLLI